MKIEKTNDYFYIELADGTKAGLSYRIVGDKIHVTSTYTPIEHRGQGIASKLMKELIKYAKHNQLKIVPKCSFAQHYCEKHKY